MQNRYYVTALSTPRLPCGGVRGPRITNRCPLLQDRPCHKRPGMLLSSRGSKMAANSKLLVRKLPQLLTKEEKDELLKQFGATSVDVLPPKGHMVWYGMDLTGRCQPFSISCLNS